MLRTSSNSRAGNHLPAFLFREICRKTYWPKHLPPCAPQQFFLGVSLRVGLSRSIFPGAVKRIVSRHCAVRAQKGYLRISLTRFASCIEKISPAIAAAERVSSACAPGSSAETGHNIQLTSSFRLFTQNIVQNFIVGNDNLCKHFK